jgi:hypothetical protein
MFQKKFDGQIGYFKKEEDGPQHDYEHNQGSNNK